MRRLLLSSALALLASPAIAQPSGEISLGRLPTSVRNVAGDTEVQALQSVTSAADKLFYFTGSGTGSVTTISSAARGLLDDATLADIRTSLGLGTAALSATGDFQAADADLTTWAGVTPSANGQSLVSAADYAAMRTAISLVPGTDVQDFDAQLSSVAGLSYGSNALKVLRVNVGETAFELATLAGGGDALVANPLSQFASTTSAQFAATISNETGTGLVVLDTAPTISAIELSHATANTLAASGGHATIESATIWDSGNDGASSTLDADLLDGNSSAAFAASGANTNISSVYLNNDGLKLKDTNATHGLSLVPGSNITVDRALTIITGDADRGLTITADSSIGGTAYVAGGTDVAVADGGTGASTASAARDALGTQYATDAEARAGTSSTVVVTPANLAARATFAAHKNGTAQTGIASNTPTKVTFETERFDIGGNFASSTWTPPAGPIHCSWGVRGATVTTYMYAHLYKNGVRYADGNLGAVGAGVSVGSTDDNANGTDTYDIYVLGDAATTFDVAGATYQTFFSCAQN